MVRLYVNFLIQSLIQLPRNDRNFVNIVKPLYSEDLQYFVKVFTVRRLSCNYEKVFDKTDAFFSIFKEC